MKNTILFLLVALLATSCSKETLVKKENTSVVLVPSQKTSHENAATLATVNFAGYTWTVKESAGTLGPGPNYWSTSNVWVDANGWLHLRANWNPSTSRWECAEVSTTTNFGYGTFQWKIDGPLSTLDRNIVFGLFNYSGNDKYDEMDIEFARWGNAAWHNLNYTIWPATGSSVTIPASYTNEMTMSGTYSTHRFTRTANSVNFKSLHGFQDGDTNIFENETFTTPTTSISTLSMPILMNLWLYNGNAPSNNQSVEIVIHDFKYTPL